MNVGGGYLILGVGGRTFGAELEHGPSAIAESNRPELFETMFLLQGFGAGFNLGEADLFRVATEEGHEVEFASLHCIGSNNLTSEAVANFGSDVILTRPH